MEALYNIIDVDFKDISQYPDVMQKIWNPESGIDGIIIRNVLSQAEIDSIKRDLHKVKDLEIRKDTGLITCPRAFAEIASESENDEKKLKVLFQEMEDIWSRFQKEFEVPLNDKFKSLLSTITGSWTPEVPKGPDGVGICAPSTFKRMLPGAGSLIAHCGNWFHNMWPYIFEHMGKACILKGQMSFFITIQPAEVGGELVLYDVQWKDAVEKVDPVQNVLVMNSGQIRDLEDPIQTKTLRLKPNAGDLLCFAGGRIWHKVSLNQGSEDRITVGGFLTPSKEGNKIYYWS